ncbi:MAG: Glycerol kinase [Candidatus Accumulibacter sp. BA-94]|nr:MAG: Glycerol kinase [Candidatus Accumulibacter sp. BA-94]
MLATIGWRLRDQTTYLLEGSVFMGGAVVQWLRDGLGMIARADEIEGLASSVPDSGGIYLVPAHTGLGAPYWDPYARGALLGMTRGTGRAHVARAALEAIAFQSVEVLGAMELDCGQRLRELRVDGGAAANNLLLQFQSDLLGVPVVRPRVTETTALGAAYLAGLAVAFWHDEAELASLWRADRRFEPAAFRARHVRRPTSGSARWMAASRRAQPQLGGVTALLMHCADTQHPQHRRAGTGRRRTAAAALRSRPRRLAARRRARHPRATAGHRRGGQVDQLRDDLRAWPACAHRPQQGELDLLPPVSCRHGCPEPAGDPPCRDRRRC